MRRRKFSPSIGVKRESILRSAVHAQRKPPAKHACAHAEQNRAAYGKCNNEHGHGHNYFVEVLVGGEVDAETGMVVDLVELDQTVRTKCWIGSTTPT